MSRGTSPSLPQPPQAEELTAFPRFELDSSCRLYRVTRADFGPWWFGNSLEGRFDLPEPAGTCYLATDPLTALLEVVGPGRQGGVISRSFIAARRLFETHVPGAMPLADFTAPHAAHFGVTLEASTLVPYPLPQAWARRLRDAGLRGVRYFARHDNTARGTSIALFGKAGARPDWQTGHGGEIPEELLRRLADERGIRVCPIPRFDQLRVDG